jgi:hypothetical protein
VIYVDRQRRLTPRDEARDKERARERKGKERVEERSRSGAARNDVHSDVHSCSSARVFRPRVNFKIATRRQIIRDAVSPALPRPPPSRSGELGCPPFALCRIYERNESARACASFVAERLRGDDRGGVGVPRGALNSDLCPEGR